MSGICGLAIEAATDRLGIAACRGERSVLFEALPARDETQRVYEHAGRLLRKLGAGLADLDFVAFGCGPGSFTGVRLAAAAAQALAFARGIPVCRVSSLAVLAAGAARELRGGLTIAACLDARMERAYVGAYRAAPDGALQAVVPDAWVDPREFALPGTGAIAVVGSGWQVHAPMLERHRVRIVAVDTGLLPCARDLLSMAIGEFRAGRTVSPVEALPEYLGQVPAVAGLPRDRQEN